MCCLLFTVCSIVLRQNRSKSTLIQVCSLVHIRHQKTSSQNIFWSWRLKTIISPASPSSLFKTQLGKCLCTRHNLPCCLKMFSHLLLFLFVGRTTASRWKIISHHLHWVSQSLEFHGLHIGKPWDLLACVIYMFYIRETVDNGHQHQHLNLRLKHSIFDAHILTNQNREQTFVGKSGGCSGVQS